MLQNVPAVFNNKNYDFCGLYQLVNHSDEDKRRYSFTTGYLVTGP